MKGNRGIREGVTKAENLEMLGRVLRWRERRCNDEAETVIVTMIADEDTALSALLAYRLKTRLDELATHTAPLQWRLDRRRTEGEPPAPRWGSHLRERDMTNDLLTKHGDERQGKCIGVAQRINDERFGSVAEREPREGARRKRPDRVPVTDRLATNYNAKTALIAQVRRQGANVPMSGVGARSAETSTRLAC